MSDGWIGIDLDGTLAEELPGPFAFDRIGPPIPLMLERVKFLIDEGADVRIFTARVAGREHSEHLMDEAAEPIRAWCVEHLGRVLPVTATKDFAMVKMYDDRAIGIETNTGQIVGTVVPELSTDHEERTKQVGGFLLQALTKAMAVCALACEPAGKWHYEWSRPRFGRLRLDWKGEESRSSVIGLAETPHADRSGAPGDSLSR